VVSKWGKESIDFTIIDSDLTWRQRKAHYQVSDLDRQLTKSSNRPSSPEAAVASSSTESFMVSARVLGGRPEDGFEV